MAKDNRQGGIGGRITIGGNAILSPLASGQNITATVTFTGPEAEERQQVLQALISIQTELAKLAGPTAPAVKSLAGTAVETAKREQPDKNEIGSLLDTALKTARQSAEFAEVAAKLAPYVQTATHWLGGQWTNLAALLT